MEEIWSGATLFEAMARSRAEWLAQGMLIRAIQHEPVLQKYLAAKVSADRPGQFRLLSESCKEAARRKKKMGQWRPDLRLEWPGAGTEPNRALDIELKLWAPLSAPQLKALAKPGTLLVAPGKYAKRYPKVEVATWAEIADHVRRERITRHLLKQIDEYAKGWCASLEWKKVDEQYASFEQPTGGRWPLLYRFLATIDEHLRALAPDRYDPSPQFAVRRTPDGEVRSYYGYYFSMQKKAALKQYWMGFFREGECVRFAVQRRPSLGEGTVWKDVGPKPPRSRQLVAKNIASAIVKLVA